MAKFNYNRSREVIEIPDDSQTSSAVDQLIGQNRNNFELGQLESSKVRRVDNPDLVVNTTNGRIMRGLNSLQTINDIIAGKSKRGLELFSAPVIVSSAEEFSTALLDDAVDIIIITMQMNVLITFVGTQNEAVSELLKTFRRMAIEIKKGTFDKLNYDTLVFVRSRDILNISDQLATTRSNLI